MNFLDTMRQAIDQALERKEEFGYIWNTDIDDYWLRISTLPSSHGCCSRVVTMNARTGGCETQPLEIHPDTFLSNKWEVCERDPTSTYSKSNNIPWAWEYKRRTGKEIK